MEQVRIKGHSKKNNKNSIFSKQYHYDQEMERKILKDPQDFKMGHDAYAVHQREQKSVHQLTKVLLINNLPETDDYQE